MIITMGFDVIWRYLKFSDKSICSKDFADFPAIDSIDPSHANIQNQLPAHDELVGDSSVTPFFFFMGRPLGCHQVPAGKTDTLLLKMVIKMVDLPSKNGEFP